jgi:hypothetical protein
MPQRYTRVEVIKMLAAEVKRIGTAERLAKAWGCTGAYLSYVLTGRKAPGPLVLGKLGLRRKTMTHYERISDA